MGSNKVAILSEWRMFKKGDEHKSEWRKNMVLDSGLIDWLEDQRSLEFSSTSSDMQFISIAVGSGETAAVKTNTSLETETYRGTVEQEFSAVVNYDDPHNPYVILGIEIPAGTDMLVISEAGVCSSDDVFFNRYVLDDGLGNPASTIKLPEDVLIVQCRITMSNPCELFTESVELTDDESPSYSQTRTFNSVMLVDGVKRLFTKDFARDTVWTASLGTSSATPTELDAGVTTPITAQVVSSDTNVTSPSVTNTGALLYIKVTFTDEIFHHDFNGTSFSEFAITGGGIDFHSSWTPAFIMDGYMIHILDVYIEVEFTR